MARGSERPDATKVVKHHAILDHEMEASASCRFRANNVDIMRARSSITMAAGDLEFVLTAKLRAPQ